MAYAKDDPYRPCENPSCLAEDSTKCAFRINTFTSMVVPSQLAAAKRSGCRVARFAEVNRRA